MHLISACLFFFPLLHFRVFVLMGLGEEGAIGPVDVVVFRKEEVIFSWWERVV